MAGSRSPRASATGSIAGPSRSAPVQCFARRAARALGRLLPTGSMARVVADLDPTDRYGRTLLYVWNADGVFVNERLVARGFARAVLFGPNDRYIEVIRSAERAAKRGLRGRWGSCGYVGQRASMVPAATGRDRQARPPLALHRGEC